MDLLTCLITLSLPILISYEAFKIELEEIIDDYQVGLDGKY
ncbi:hypothetical protein [Salinivibrio costicola]|nr:hypothetical protein [Salinivibrio costicola]